jgi:hypothetical protein
MTYGALPLAPYHSLYPCHGITQVMRPTQTTTGVEHMTQRLQRSSKENLRMDFRMQNRFNCASGARATFL